jgi:thiosulfate/3-mercaptopyruvate sulfurtransferase
VPTGTYCGSGVNASALVLALERAGLTTADRPAALYAGSWSHWCTDPRRPVATGPDR